MRSLSPGKVFQWLFSSSHGLRGRLVPRWIFLRALAIIYFSAFYSLLFQIKGLIGPEGICLRSNIWLPIAGQLGVTRYWYAPSALLDLEQLIDADGGDMDRPDRIGDCISQSMAAAQLLRLLRLLPLVHRRVGRFFKLSIGRHAARGGLPGAVLCAAGNAAGMGRGPIRHRARASSCCNGSGSAFTSNPAW